MGVNPSSNIRVDGNPQEEEDDSDNEEGEETISTTTRTQIAFVVGILQFILGAWLWVRGQQIGSLSVTGLGYWVVFDAFGVGLSTVLPVWLDRQSAKTLDGKIRRPYGLVSGVFFLKKKKLAADDENVFFLLGTPRWKRY